MESKDLRNFAKLNVYLIRSCDVLRHKFRHEWKFKYGEEWNATSIEQLIHILGDLYIKKRLRKIQRNNVKSGNIDEWDIMLLKQLLLNKYLFSLTTAEENNIQELVDIRNKTAHYGSQNMSDCEFETYRKQLCDAIIALGDNEDELKKLECDDSIGGIEFSSDDVINDENVAEAKTLKDLGNKEFSCESYDKAIKHYTSAILLAGLRSTDRAMLYSNRCICYFKLNDFDNAAKDAKDTVKLWPQWWKGYYRLSQIYIAKDDYESLTKAEKCLIKAEAFGQKDEITELLSKVRHKIGPIDRNEFLDYRTHITSIEDSVDNYNKNTGLNVNVNAIKEMVKRNSESDNIVLKNRGECMRGHGYRYGTDGMPLNYEKAAQCFSKAAKRGSAEGMFYLALMFLDGKGVKQDFKSALKYFIKAAQQPTYIDSDGHMKIPNLGVAEAENALGLCYQKGMCVKKDLLKAIEWYQKGVDHGCSTSANNLGLIYMNGEEFIARDLDKAEQLFKFAVSKVDPNAMANMVYLYIIKDEPELALEWCDRIRNKNSNYPNLEDMETVAKKRLSELENTFKYVSGGETINDDEKSHLTLKEKLFEKLSETSPLGVNVLQKIKEMNEHCFNKSKSPVNKIEKMLDSVDSYGNKYDVKTLEEYAKSGKLYAKKLLTAQNHFQNAVKALYRIKDCNNSSIDELKNFIKHLSHCFQLETIVASLSEPIEQFVLFALNNNIGCDEDVRICNAVINFKDINGNIIFLNQCLKLYPKNVFFLETRGNMFAFRDKFEKSVLDFNSALKLAPNDYELLYLKAASMSQLENIDYDRVIDAYNQFLSTAPEDHRQIPACYYSMAYLNLFYRTNYNEAQKYYSMGLNAEHNQLSFFLPYDFSMKSKVNLFLQLNRNENIPISPQQFKSKSKHLTDAYRIHIIRKHREYIKKFIDFDETLDSHRNQNEKIIKYNISVKPPKIQKSEQSLSGLKCISLRDMDLTTDKVYNKCIIDLKVIDVVGTTGSSLFLVIEDINKYVERCCIYNSPHLKNIKKANQMYGIGCQFSVINPYLRITRDTSPAIRIDDINSIVMRETIKDMCRYCCEANAIKVCSRCKTAMYCSKECQTNDWKQNWHKFICY